MIKQFSNAKYHLIILLLILAACIFLLFGRLLKTGSAIGGDAVHYYIVLRSIIVDQDLDFKNEYEYFYSQTSNFTGNRKIPLIPEKNKYTQKLPLKYPVGSTILLAPSFLSIHLLLSTLHKLGLNIVVDGYNIIYQIVTALTSLAFAFVGILLIYDLGRRFFKNSLVALLGVLGIWLATPLIYYMTMEPLNSQPLSFFIVSLFIYFHLLTRKKRTIFQWAILGIIGGLMSIIRYQDSLFLLIPLIDLRRFWGGPVILLISTLLIISIQLVVNNHLFGSPLYNIYASQLHTSPGSSPFPYLTSPRIFYSLFSFERGLLVWSPILIFSFIGFYWFTKRSGIIGGLLVSSFIAQLYIVSSWNDPSQGDSFGNRILLNSNLILALGLMQYIDKTKNLKLFLLILACGIFLNFLLMGLFIFRIIGQPY